MKIVSRVAAVTLVVASTAALSVGLSGCASWGLSQRGWADALKRTDGVTAVEWHYTSGWPESGSRYDATITLSPKLTEKQAKEIARVSCAHDTHLTDLKLTTTDDYNAPSKVEEYALTDACLDEEGLVQFSRVAAAVRALGDGFVGEVSIYGVHEGDPAFGPDARDGIFEVSVAAQTNQMMLDALSEIHPRITDRTLGFTGNTSDSGHSLTAFGPPLDITLEPSDDLGRLMPVIAQAQRIDGRGVAYAGNTVSVTLASTDMRSSPELAELRSLAATRDMTVEAALPALIGGDAASQAALIDALVAVPGGANVTIPGEGQSGEATVTTHDFAGVEAAVRILAGATDIRNTFRVYAPEPGMFWVSVQRGVDPKQPFDAAFAAATRARNELSGVDRVILDLTRGKTQLTVYLTDAGMSSGEPAARALLTEFARSGTFDEVRLGGGSISFQDQVVR